MESWKDIKGYEGFYQVSNYGRVKSLERLIIGKGGTTYLRKEKILQPQKTGFEGYLSVTLYKDGNGKQYKINRLVYATFIAEIPEDMQVNHIDENILNNKLENLNLMSPRENNNWGTRIIRAKAKQINGKCSKPVLQYDLKGNFIKEWPSINEIERQLGFNAGNISNYISGKKKVAYNYMWKFKDAG